MYTRPLSIAIFVIAGFVAASEVLALGFGRVPESIAFGQALDVSVPLHLDAGESLAPGCVRAEVHVGEQRLAPGAVVVTLEHSGVARDDMRLRIRSSIVVREPLVALNLTLGCAGSVSRQFVVFADPPQSRVDATQVAEAESALAPAQTLSVAPAQAQAVAASRAAVQTAAGGASGKALGNTQRRSPIGARHAATTAVRKTQAAASSPRAAAKPRTVALSARTATPLRSSQATAPRLTLEDPAELLKAATLAVAAQDAALASATQAASAAQSAASAADQRLMAMESNLTTLREQAAAQRATTDLMRTRLAQAEGPSRTLTALQVIVAALGGLALWLGWRVRSLQRERQAAWWQGAHGAQQAAAASEPAVAATEAALALPEPAASASLPIETHPAPSDAAVVLTQSTPIEGALTRPASVDELIDLEQQAEFFLVLGEEDSAVDLLMSHLRRSGGTSPLPYLKLLQIQRRRGDREAHARLRQRFGQRFNAVAPAWDADADLGRDLQDYPAVLDALQACWQHPSAAMAELEDLLYGHRSGELLELPAFRDVLTLYSVARDLHRRIDSATSDVDMLLPLALDDDLLLTAPTANFDTVASGHGDAASANRIGGPVDLDLDLSEPPPVRDSRAGELSPLHVTLGESLQN